MNTNYDLIVAGGGLTGVAASVCAARRGLKVLLAEVSGCLGGAISQNLVFPFMPYITTADVGGKKEKVVLSRGFSKNFAKCLKKRVNSCIPATSTQSM